MAWITAPVLGTGSDEPKSCAVTAPDNGKLQVVVDDRHWISPLDTTEIISPYADGYPQ